MNEEKVIKAFKECEIKDGKIVINNDLLGFVELVKDKYNFDILKEIIAIDNKEQGVELLYRLYSTHNRENLVLSFSTQKEVESVSKFFDSAIADEKEIFDLFGINFIGNEELKRLYMPESWLGHPLRKDYQENDERLDWND